MFVCVCVYMSVGICLRITSEDRDDGMAWKGVWWALCKWKSPPADLWELNGYRRRPTGRGARDRAAGDIRSDGWTDGQTASGERELRTMYICIFIFVFGTRCRTRWSEREGRERESVIECGVVKSTRGSAVTVAAIVKSINPKDIQLSVAVLLCRRQIPKTNPLKSE
jgi:hypothetical protein